MNHNNIDIAEGYKILQLADCHISYPFTSKNKQIISEAITKEEPNLIVFTGDQFHETCFYHEGVALVKEFIAFIDSFEIKWCFIFGNHDPEINVSKREILQLIIDRSKNFIGEIGPDYTTLHHENCQLYKDERIGNYYLKLFAESEKTLLIMLDSGRYDDDRTYASLTDNQINYVKDVLEKEKASSVILFFHIPLIEHKFAYERFLVSGKRRENDCTQKNSPDLINHLSRNTQNAMVFCGHDHVNDYVAQLGNVSLGITPGLCHECYNDDEVRGYRLFEYKNSEFSTRIERMNI